jgi:tRNA(Ile2) C34 agmatinyltransferase TiaS
MTKGTKNETLARLQDANKKLRSQVRQLRKQLKTAANELLLLEEIWQVEVTELKTARRNRKKSKENPVCPQCGNDDFDIKKIGVWIIERCGSCEHWKRYQED